MGFVDADRSSSRRVFVCLSPPFCRGVIVKSSVEESNNGARESRPSRSDREDRALRLPNAAGVVCPRCGARVGKPCVATVPYLGVGAVGMPIDGMHSERIASALEAGTV